MFRRRALVAIAALLSIAGAACTDPVEEGIDPPAAISTSPPSSPSPPPRLIFAVKGDWGAGTPEQASVTNQMCSLRQEHQFDVVVTTGDNFYRPDGTATQRNYFGPESCLLSHDGHQWRAAWGNHDVAGNSTAGVLGAADRTYTWSEEHVQFFMLDSNRAGDRAQEEWLAGALAASDAPVKIVVFHHPPFTVGLHENALEVRRRWVPLFERHGVRLVLNGHNHGYEHSQFNGVHYVVTGGGGAQLYPCVDDQPWLLTCLSVHHFLLVQVEGTMISVRAVGAGGQDVDSFAIEPAGDNS